VGSLQTAGVSVHFEGVRAVDAVDLELEEGEILGLIGPNGAGKTTLLNAVSRFLPLTAGAVRLLGADVTGWSRQKLARAGVVRTFQGVATFPQLTVLENIEIGQLTSVRSRRRAQVRARELATRFGLDGLEELPAASLAHGQERKLGIARAVAMNPRFLLLDEPATGLNDAESASLSDAIRGLRELLGCGVLLVEHDMRVIFGVCDRIQVLDSGRTIAVGAPRDVATNPDVTAAYLGIRGARLAAGT
jgi:branched-chain amino acid transport system ATP-binding protein